MKKELIEYLTETYGKADFEVVNTDGSSSVISWIDEYKEISVSDNGYPENSVRFEFTEIEIVQQKTLDCVFFQEWKDVKQILELFGI